MAKKKPAPRRATAARGGGRKGSRVATRAPRASARPDADKPSSARPGRRRQSPSAGGAAPRSAAPGAADFAVVGISVGEGGHDACADLIGGLPSDLSMAVVVAPQTGDRPADAELLSVLSARSPMPVLPAAEGAPLQPGHVYVVPRGAVFGVSGGRFHAAPPPERDAPMHAADFFLRSLAADAGVRAVGVVMCGSDVDGTVGLQEIKGAGGIAIAQDPRTAVQDGAPRSAITTGAVDLVLPPRHIARELTRLAAQPPPAMAPDTDPDGDSPAGPGAAGAAPVEHVAHLFSVVRAATGVDFTHYKYPTIQRRLQRRMLLHKIDSLEEYVRFLKRHPAEVQALHHDLLIKVTRFFRDPDTFDTLARKVFPHLLADAAGAPVRIWVPGCSTGEEPYSVAIALLEYMADHHAGVPVQIFATDVSERAVEQARAGTYPESIAADVSPVRLRRYFAHADGRYQIAKPVRDLCVFARQDLTRDPPFSRLDLVLCRNVLIYLGPVLQKRLMHTFHYALKPTGFLMLGSAETTGLYSELFGVVDKKHRLYRKKPASVRPEMTFRAGGTAAAARSDGDGDGEAWAPRGGALQPLDLGPGPAAGAPGTIQREANRVILNRFAPPGVIVTEDDQIVQFRGQTGLFLQPAPGEASLNLLKMAREGLLYGLRTALHEARARKAPVRKTGLRVRHDTHSRHVTVEVVPLAPAGAPPHYLVLFEDRVPPAAAARRRPGPRPRGKVAPAENRRVAQLEDELAASREYLQSIIQDMESANEELQSANEEILSSNEELQSTNEELDTAKEELQSTNEELNTLNEELHGRNDELSRVNSDLLNLLANIQLAIVMVDGQHRVRRFTPVAERLLNLIPTDVGRRISDIKPNVDAPDLEQMISESIDTVSVRERDVRDREGRRYVLRVRPYKNLEHRIDGAVLALIDVEDARRHEKDAQAADKRALAAAERRDYAEAVVNTVREPLMVLRGDQTVRSVNRAFCEAFGLRLDEAVGRSLGELLDGYFDTPPFRELLRRVLDDNAVENFRVDQAFPNLGRRVLLINASRVAPDGHDPDLPPLILLAVVDVTDTAAAGDGDGGDEG